MVKVKPLDEIKKHYREGATVAPTRYKDGVTRAAWKESAASREAEELFKAKMSEALAEERRRKAIEKLTDEDWRKPALEKGATRIGPGMTAAVDKHAARFAPFRSALEGLTLPPKSADPIANVDNRVKPVVEVLVAKKKELLG